MGDYSGRMAVRGTLVTNADWADCAPGDAWNAIIPCDLTRHFTGMGPLVPAITSVTDQTGDWDEAGQSRTIHLADGSSVSERIDAVDRPHTFNYTVGPFSGPIGKLVEHASGEFVFEELGGGTSVRWSYDWKPKPGARVIVLLLARLWNAYAKRVLARLAIDAGGG